MNRRAGPTGQGRGRRWVSGESSRGRLRGGAGVLLGLLGCLLVATPLPAEVEAEEQRPSLVDLDELSIEALAQVEVITSSRTTPMQSSTAPATILVVTAEQIRIRNYRSLLDLLYDCPNIKVDYANDPRWMSDVSIRGIWGMDKFIIMIDGVRVSSPTNEAIPIMENYPVRLAKQVEIIYGPASALYGADAFSGVINIITKDREEMEGSGELAVGGGMYEEYSGDFLAGLDLGKGVELKVFGQYFHDEQPDLAEFYEADFAGRDQALSSGTFDTIYGLMTPRTPVEAHASYPLEAYAVHAALEWQGLEVSLFSNASQNPTSIANKPNNAVHNRDVYFAREITVGSATYSTSLGSLDSRTFLIGSWHRLLPESSWRNVYTSMEPSYQYSYGRMLKAEQLLTYRASDNLRLTGGVTYEDFLAIPDTMDLAAPVSGRHDLDGIIVNSDIYTNHPEGIPARFAELRYSNAGGLLEASYAPGDEVSLTLGARYDENSRYGSSFNPRLGLTWSPCRWFSTKLLYGTAFLAPSPYASHKEFGSFVSFDDGLTFQSFFMRLSNPDLEPQENRTYELSTWSALRKDLGLSVSAFHSELRNLYAQVNDADYGNRYGGVYPVEGHEWPIAYVETVVNLGEQHNYGGTIRLDYQRFLRRGKVTIYGAISYVDGTVDPDGSGPQGRVEIGGVAPFSAVVGADVVHGRFTVSPRLVVMDRQRTHPQQAGAFSSDDPSERQTIDGYQLLSLDLRYELGRSVVAFARARNVLDQRYRTVNLGAAPEGLEAGSAAVEFEDGAPQNPFRLFAGLEVSF